MTTPASICQHCGADTSSAGGLVLCNHCQRTARSALTNVIAYREDLFLIGAGPSGIKVRHEASDPTGETATMVRADVIEEVAIDAKNRLSTWMRALLDDRPQAPVPPDHFDAIARALSHHIKTIATLSWAGSFLHDILNLEHRMRRVIEANKARWYAGMCGWIENAVTCSRVLYADPDSDFVRCPVCRTTWPVRERRQILLDQARDEVTNVATIARALVTLLDNQPSQARLERRIQNWIDRGVIERQGSRDIDGRVRKVYRLGDVLDTLTRELGRRSA